MTKTAIRILIIALVLILVQVIVLNHVCLWGVAVPFAFIYVILRLPLTLNSNYMLTFGFLLGIIVDIFSDTQGMNALACTIAAALRKPVIRLYLPREDELGDLLPSMQSLGASIYIKYALSMSLLYCSLIFLIEAFSVLDILMLILRIVCSTLLTTLFLICIDCITVYHGEKRL